MLRSRVIAAEAARSSRYCAARVTFWRSVDAAGWRGGEPMEPYAPEESAVMEREKKKWLRDERWKRMLPSEDPRDIEITRLRTLVEKLSQPRLAIDLERR